MSVKQDLWVVHSGQRTSKRVKFKKLIYWDCSPKSSRIHFSSDFIITAVI